MHIPSHDVVEVIGLAQDRQLSYRYRLADELLWRLREQLSPADYPLEGRRRPRELLALALEVLSAQHADSPHVAHACLNELLQRRFVQTADSVDQSPLMFELQQSIVHFQLEADLRAIAGEQLPQSAEAFATWFAARCQPGVEGLHPLFAFLASSADSRQFRDFIEVEAGVHVAFDDVIALAQVGVRGLPKAEFLRNLEDEIGGQDPDRFHLTMFMRLVSALGIRSVRRAAMPWQALACGNYMMFLALFRSFYPYCIGYLGHLEALTPLRFASIAHAGRRLGLEPGLLAYHTEHSVLDSDHAHGWLHHIILPFIQDHGPQAARDVATGVCLRELVAKRYWDALLAQLTSTTLQWEPR